MDMQLGVNAFQMVVNRMRTQPQALGDFLAGQTAGKQSEHLPFARGQSPFPVPLTAAGVEMRDDPQRDFAPVSLVARQPVLLVVNPAVPATSVREFVAYTKERPGTVDYSTSTSTFMLAGEQFTQITGANMQNIPFNGGSVASLTAVVSGTVDASMVSGPTAIQTARDGRLRVLAVSGAARLDDLRDVPTFAEAGVAGFDIPVWSAVFAPAGSPRPVVDRLNAAIVRALRAPAVAKRFQANVETVVASTPEELAETLARDGARVRDLAARIGLVPR